MKAAIRILFLIWCVLTVALIIGVVKTYGQTTQRPKMVLRVETRTSTGMLITEPLKVRIVLGIRPQDPEQHYAPLEKNSLMICQPSTNEGVLSFRCGSDVYVLDQWDIQSEKP